MQRNKKFRNSVFWSDYHTSRIRSPIIGDHTTAERRSRNSHQEEATVADECVTTGVRCTAISFFLIRNEFLQLDFVVVRRFLSLIFHSLMMAFGVVSIISGGQHHPVSR